MANYPTSVFSPASRSNGQTIDASHINALQDEVTAIEDGLRNATAPLNSSRSTVAALSVTGGSTLATLSVSGASTFAQRPVMPRTPTCKVSIGAVQLANGVEVSPNWVVEEFDDAGLHSTSANSSRITFTSSGVWAVGAYVKWSSGSPTSSQLQEVYIVQNDTGYSVAHDARPFSTQTSVQTVNGICVAGSTSEYATVRCYQATGSTRSLSSGYFWAYKVSD